MDVQFDPSFDPVRCAQLHNQLLVKAVSHIPDANQRFQRDVITRWQNCPPAACPNKITILESSPLYNFLSLINSFDPGKVPLTAEYTQPEPGWFDSEMHEMELQIRGRPFILLYADESDQPAMEGGLYFDLETNLVCWGRLSDGWHLPPDDQWVSLQFALEKALGMWESGKFYLGSPENSNPGRMDTVVCYKDWLPRDLESALFRWEDILNAIQDRIPLPKGTPRPPLLDPLPAALVDQFDLSSFAKAFLCTAKRPSFTFVAPAITVFTPELFAGVYGAESPDSRRRKRGVDSDPISLILPSTTGPMQGTSADEIFDGEIYLPKADPTYYEYTGVFTVDQGPGTDGDGLILITPEGAEDPIRYDGHRPWGPDCPIRLEEMFDTWYGYIQNGEWTVGPEGIDTPADWYLDPDTVDLRRMLWTEESR